MISVADIRATLGYAYSTIPDDVIQQFIDRREEELKALIRVEYLASAPYPALLKKWLINTVCCDVIAYDLLGIPTDQPLEYSIGELRENLGRTADMKVQWYNSLREAAELALETYFIKTVGYRAVKL